MMDWLAVGRTLRDRAFAATTAHTNAIYDIACKQKLRWSYKSHRMTQRHVTLLLHQIYSDRMSNIIDPMEVKKKLLTTHGRE